MLFLVSGRIYLGSIPKSLNPWVGLAVHASSLLPGGNAFLNFENTGPPQRWWKFIGKKHKKKKNTKKGCYDVWFKFDQIWEIPKKCKFGNLGTQELGHENTSFGTALSLVKFSSMSPGKILKQAACSIPLLLQNRKLISLYFMSFLKHCFQHSSSIFVWYYWSIIPNKMWLHCIKENHSKRSPFFLGINDSFNHVTKLHQPNTCSPRSPRNH